MLSSFIANQQFITASYADRHNTPSIARSPSTGLRTPAGPRLRTWVKIIVVEKDEPLHPLARGLFGAGAVAASPQAPRRRSRSLGFYGSAGRAVPVRLEGLAGVPAWAILTSCSPLRQSPDMVTLLDIRTSPATGKSTAFPGGNPRAKPQRGLTSRSSDASVPLIDSCL